MKQNIKIVKIGGNVINSTDGLRSFLIDFSKMEGLKILVHGGGTKATEMAKKLGLEAKMLDGRRITDEANLEVVTMVYAGLLNKNIIAQMQQNNCNAIGLTGADANTILSHKRVVKDIDYGFAGDIDRIDSHVLQILLENNLTPVFCAITHDKKGQLLNTNADTIASEIAGAISSKYEVELVYCFEKEGVLSDIHKDGSVIKKIDSKRYIKLKKDGIITQGMMPKIDNCFYALKNGVKKVIIGKPEVISNKQLIHTKLVL